MKKLLETIRENLLPYQGPQAVAIVALYLVVILSLFFEDYLETSFFTLLVVALSYGSFLLLLVSHSFRKIQILNFSLVLLVLAFFATILFSKVWYWSLLDFLQFTSFLVFFYLVVSLTKKHKQRLSLIYFLILVSFFSTLVGFYDFFLSEKALEVKRFYGTIHMHVFAAGYLLLVIPLVFVLFLYAKPKWQTLLLGFLSFFFTLALFLTFARGAWLALFLQFLFVGIVARESFWQKKFYVTGILGAVLIAAFFVSSPQLILGRLASIAFVGNPERSAQLQPSIPYDTGGIHRLDNYKNSLKIFKDHPAFGIGLKNYGFVYHQYQDKPWIYSSVSHSSYLDFLAQTGLIGSSALLIFALVCFRLFRGYLFSLFRKPKENFHGLAILGGIFGSLIHMAIDSDLSIPVILLVFLLELALFLSFALDQVSSREIFRPFSFLQKSFLTAFFLSGIMLAFTAAYAVFYFQKGQAAAKNGRRVLALDLYKKSLKLNPILPFTYESLGGIYWEEDNSEIAIWYFKRASELNPYYPEHHFNLALAFAQGGEEAKAAEYFKETLRLGPYTTPRYYNALAQFYLADEKKVAAKETYEAAVAHFPYNGVYQAYGYMYSLMRKHIVESYLSLASLEAEAGNNGRASELIKAQGKF